MSHPTIRYPIADIPRDRDPASKIDIGALRAWWEDQHEQHETRTLLEVIENVKSTWPATLPAESWYIAVYSTLITCGKPVAIVPIFKYLVRDAQTVEEIKALGDRFKDVLMKLWTIIGIVQLALAMPHLARAEMAAVIALKPELDDDAMRAKLNAFLSFERQVADSRYIRQDTGLAVDQRGFDSMLQVYRHNLPGIMGTWRRHQADIEWLEMKVVYGLFLSDFSVLTVVESELAVLPAIMAQDVLGPTMWHTRGLQRLGVSKADVNVVLETVKRCSAWAGRELKEVAELAAEDVDVEWDPNPSS